MRGDAECGREAEAWADVHDGKVLPGVLSRDRWKDTIWYLRVELVYLVAEKRSDGLI